jgi:predicted lipoprotein
MPIHHDREFAQERGAPNTFMNILTSNGILATYLEEWAGPQAEIKEMNASLVVPNFPGDNMVMNARIVKKWESAGEHLIELQYSGDNNMGPHISGTAIMCLPTRG